MNPLKQAKQFSIPDPLTDIFIGQKLPVHIDATQVHTRTGEKKNVSAQTQAFRVSSRLQPSQGPRRTWWDRGYASMSPDDPASQVSAAPNESLYLHFTQQQQPLRRERDGREKLSVFLEVQGCVEGTWDFLRSCWAMWYFIHHVLPRILISMFSQRRWLSFWHHGAQSRVLTIQQCGAVWICWEWQSVLPLVLLFTTIETLVQTLFPPTTACCVKYKRFTNYQLINASSSMQMLIHYFIVSLLCYDIYTGCFFFSEILMIGSFFFF